MRLGEMNGRERVAVLAALLLVGVVFVVTMVNYFNPPEQVWEAKIFAVYHTDESTLLFSYGEGKLKLPGRYEFELDETYRITYRSRSRNWAEFDIRVEKIS
jgi:hypothetical protein